MTAGKDSNQALTDADWVDSTNSLCHNLALFDVTIFRLSVLTLYLDQLNTATYVQPPTVRALIADPSNVNTLKSTRPSGFFFFFFLLCDQMETFHLVLHSHTKRETLCVSWGEVSTEKSSEPQRPFTAITDYRFGWKQGMDLAGERQPHQRQPFSFRVHYLASLSFHFFSPRQGRQSETRSGSSVVPPPRPLQTLPPRSITSLPPALHPSPLHYQPISPSICYPLSLSLRLSTALLLPWNHYGALLPWQRR